MPTEIVSAEELEEMSLSDYQAMKKMLESRKKQLSLVVDSKKLGQVLKIVDKMEMFLDMMSEDKPAMDIEHKNQVV